MHFFTTYVLKACMHAHMSPEPKFSLEASPLAQRGLVGRFPHSTMLILALELHGKMPGQGQGNSQAQSQPMIAGTTQRETGQVQSKPPFSQGRRGNPFQCTLQTASWLPSPGGAARWGRNHEQKRSRGKRELLSSQTRPSANSSKINSSSLGGVPQQKMVLALDSGNPCLHSGSGEAGRWGGATHCNSDIHFAPDPEKLVLPQHQHF